MGHNLSLWQRAGAEALAAFALVFSGCGAIIADQHCHGALGSVGISLVSGLIIMVMIYATGHLSGAHTNPSMRIAFTLTRHFSPRGAIAYIAAQLTGATLAVGAAAATRDRRRDRPRRPVRRTGHRSVDEARPLVRTGADLRHLDRFLGVRRRADRGSGRRCVGVPARSR
jgi:hypothetical protein